MIANMPSPECAVNAFRGLKSFSGRRLLPVSGAIIALETKRASASR
jgi:hypothetical protein